MRNRVHAWSTITAVALTLGLGESPGRADPGGVPGEIAALQAQVNSLQAQVSNLQATVMALQHNSVLALNGVLTYSAATKAATFTGANVVIVNGRGTTASANGVGNLIVGYNEPNSGLFFCTDGQFLDQLNCVAHGDIWGDTQQLLGSHNIVIGEGHSFTRFGGLVVGNTNVINRDFASVSGGRFNIASGISSSLSGGSLNLATGDLSSVSGGDANDARGQDSSVSGGNFNTASGDNSSVSGGFTNSASGFDSSVSGGVNNIASGEQSSVSGGPAITASSNAGWAAGTFHSP